MRQKTTGAGKPRSESDGGLCDLKRRAWPDWGKMKGAAGLSEEEKERGQFRLKKFRGYGTLEELLEVITWAQLGIHSKPVGLLNVDGYYNLLLAFIDKAVDDGFIKPAQRHILVSAPDARGLVQKLEEYESVQDETPKLRWGMEQVVYNSTPQAEIART